MTSLCVRMDSDIEYRLANLARRTGQSRAHYVRRALREVMPRMEWEEILALEDMNARTGYSILRGRDEVEEKFEAAEWSAG